MDDSLYGLSGPLLKKYDRPGPRYTSYPTAPCFRPVAGVERYRHAVEHSNGDLLPRPLSLYLHIPFCEKLCYYCACNKIITHDHQKADIYLRYLEREIELQAELFDPDRLVSQIHLGGGTPTFLDDHQLTRLMDTLARHFRLDISPARDFSLEVDPRTVTGDRLEWFHALGFNRISFGVQDFDPAVQRAVNREQSEAAIGDLVRSARQAGFRSINLDLIYGLPLQTRESFAVTLEKVLALRPDRVAAYGYAHLPGRFRSQRLIRTSDLPGADDKLDLLRQLVERLRAGGYRYIGMDHFALPDDELSRALDDGLLHRNFQGYSTHARCDLLGMGVSAIGNIGDHYCQNEKSLRTYYQALDQDRLPIALGYTRSADDRLRHDVIQQLMCLGCVDFESTARRHGIDFLHYFQTELEALSTFVEDGLIRCNEHGLYLRPGGRLVMRNLAMVFDAHLGNARETRHFSRTV